MPAFLFTNNAHTTLAAPLSPSDTTVQLATGTGALFPNPTGGDVFGLSLVDAATGLITEITYCTARTGDNCTVERAQEGTPALSWDVGDIAANLVTAAMMAGAGGLSEVYVQQQPGNYAVDVGSANAMVISLSPAVTSYASIAGAAIRVLKAANANTGTCTLNIDGVGPVNVILPSGANVPSGGMPGHALLELSYNAHYDYFQLLSVTAGAGPSGPAGGVLSGDYPNPGFANAPPFTVLANTTNASAMPNWAPYASLGWAQLFASPGYVIFPNGEILQWGVTNVATGSARFANVIIDFAEAFPTACLSVVANMQTNLANDPSAASNNLTVVTYDYLDSSFTARIDSNAGVSGDNLPANVTVAWMATGH